MVDGTGVVLLAVVQHCVDGAGIVGSDYEFDIRVFFSVREVDVFNVPPQVDVKAQNGTGENREKDGHENVDEK